MVTVPLYRVQSEGVRPHVGSCVPLGDCTLEGRLTWRKKSLDTTLGEMNLEEELGCFTSGSEGVW